MSNTSEIKENVLMSLEDKKVEERVNLKKKRVVRKTPHHELAQIILKKVYEKKNSIKGTGYGTVMKLPLSSIRAIDGVECDSMIMVIIHQYLQSKIEFTLRMEAIMVKGKFDNPHVYYHETFYTEYDVCKIEDVLATILDDKLVNLKHRAMMCMFVYKDEYEIRELIDERLKNNGVDMHRNACAVCFEPTRAKTECNHTLCVPCADRIAVLAFEKMDGEEADEENNDGHPYCPLCRQGGHFHITF